MRVFVVCVLLMLVGTNFMFLSFKTNSNNTSLSFHDIVYPNYEIDVFMRLKHNRKLKEIMKSYKKPRRGSAEKKRDNANNFDIEDYPQIDPAPSSKANIHAGPIEHGTPLMPYIPKPTPPTTPPSRSNYGSSP